MAPAYGAAVGELARQNEFSTGFVKAAKDFASVLGKIRGKEQKRRRVFAWDEIKRYLPDIRGGNDVPAVQVCFLRVMIGCHDWSCSTETGV
jgi:hypothetical protein